MKDFGFVKIATATPVVKVADPFFNAQQTLALLKQAANENVQAVVFPELGLSGYSCADLFLQPTLLTAVKEALSHLLTQTQKLDIIFLVGLPVRVKTLLFNAAAVCYKGKICAIVPKSYLTNYKASQETRWFVRALAFAGREVTLCGQTVPMGTDLLFQTPRFNFAVELGTDAEAVEPPSGRGALQGADIIFNLAASSAHAGKAAYTRRLIAQQSARCLCAYAYSSCGFGESSTDVVFGGHAWIYENGCELACAKGFSQTAQLVCAETDIQSLRYERAVNTSFRTDAALETACPYTRIEIAQPTKPLLSLTRLIDPTPFIPSAEKAAENYREIFSMQLNGLATRLLAARSQTAVIGISGGLDSTLALLVTTAAFDALGWQRKQIVGVTMPGFGTTDRTYHNALELIKQLGCTLREIPIKKACLQHFADIKHNPAANDSTYENAQARERTQILMDVANQTNGLVIGTGDLSELALGWCTYNGDHMAMYGVNASVPKTLVKELVLWVSTQNGYNKKIQQILTDIAATPISPELLPHKKGTPCAQKTEDLVGPYVLHDFFLYHLLHHGATPAKIAFLAKHAFKGQFSQTLIHKWLRVFLQRFFAQQFKRSCMPDGPQASCLSLSPRGGWRMPSDASGQMWLTDLEKK